MEAFCTMTLGWHRESETVILPLLEVPVMSWRTPCWSATIKRLETSYHGKFLTVPESTLQKLHSMMPQPNQQSRDPSDPSKYRVTASGSLQSKDHWNVNFENGFVVKSHSCRKKCREKRSGNFTPSKAFFSNPESRCQTKTVIMMVLVMFLENGHSA